MNKNAFLMLLAVTAVVLVLAVWAVKSDPTAASEVSSRGKLFEGLPINDVAAVTITKAGETLRMVHGEGGWGLAERGGFPVQFARVKESLMAVKELEVVEPKTANPALHAQLGLDSPDAEGSSAARIVLEDAAGKRLAALIVGEQKPGQRPTLYVRRDGEDRTYECRGRFASLGADAKSWVDTDVMKLDAKRTRSATITHQDGEVVRVFRASDAVSSYEVADLPPGRELRWTGIANPIGMLLNSLRLEDFAPLAEVDFDAAPGPRAVFETFDGLIVEVWCTTRPAGEGGDGGDAGDAGEGDQAESKDWIRLVASQRDDAAAEVAAEVESINTSKGPWAFQIASYQAGNLKKRMSELLKELEEPSEDAVGPLPMPLGEELPGDAEHVEGEHDAEGAHEHEGDQGEPDHDEPAPTKPGDGR